MSTTVHIPVLLEEVVFWLQGKQPGKYLDCTFGGGGHSRALLEANPENAVVAIDRDTAAVERSQSISDEFEDRFSIVQGCFSELGKISETFNGILVDLGMSTDQLKEGRGFAFYDEGALDMRMDSTAEKTADEVVNAFEPRDLLTVLRRGGVRRYARELTEKIVSGRPIQSSKHLSSIVASVLSNKPGKSPAKNPATVVFQAIRMEVNNELDEMRALLDAVPSRMQPGGRFAAITFHSLEDQVITKTMRSWEGKNIPPALWGATPSDVVQYGKLLTRKAITPGEEEIQKNRAARSARLRVFEFKKEI